MYARALNDADVRRIGPHSTRTGGSTNCWRRGATPVDAFDSRHSWAATPTTSSHSARSGRCGARSTPSADVEDSTAGIDLGAVTTSMTINGPAAVIFAMYVANQKEPEWSALASAARCRTTFLKEYQAQKEFIFPPRPSLRLVADTMRSATAEMRVAPVVDLRLPHPGGGLAAPKSSRSRSPTGRVRRGGLASGPRHRRVRTALSFFFNAHIDFFEEIAKYRAARRIWARWLRERYGAQKERSLRCGSTPRPRACR